EPEGITADRSARESGLTGANRAVMIAAQIVEAAEVVPIIKRHVRAAIETLGCASSADQFNAMPVQQSTKVPAGRNPKPVILPAPGSSLHTKLGALPFVWKQPTPTRIKRY